MTRRSIHSAFTRTAFTLLELIMVMLIIALIAGMAAPALVRFTSGQGVENFGRRIVGAAKYARAQSISDARIYRLNFDANAGQFWLTVDAGGGNFKAASGDFSQRFTAPKGVRVQVVPDVQAPPSPVVLLPLPSNVEPQVYSQPTQLLDGTATTAGTIWTYPQSSTFFQFRPSGRTDPATISLVDTGTGRKVQIVCSVATDNFHIQEATR